MLRPRLASALVLAVGAGGLGVDGVHAQAACPFEVAVDSLRSAYGVPGMTAAWTLADGRGETAASGLADVEAGVPMTLESRMLAASVGKTFVAAAAATLAADGALDLDAPAARWLGRRPPFDRIAHWDAVTLRHLLQHTSGLADHVHTEAFARAFRDAGPDWAPAPDSLVALVAEAEPLFAPGEGWAYSDTGYLVAGLVLEAAAGRPVEDVVARRVLRPLALSHTAPSNRRAIAGLAAGYTSPDNPFGLPSKTTVGPGLMAWNPAVEGAGGGFASTSADLARWGLALVTGRALGDDALTEMLRAVPTGSGGQYGLGIAVTDGEHGTQLGHRGWVPGYVASLQVYPRYGLAVAFQVNTDVGMTDGEPPPVAAVERALVGTLASCLGLAAQDSPDR